MTGGEDRRSGKSLWCTAAALLVLLLEFPLSKAVTTYCARSAIPGYDCTVVLMDPNFEFHWRFIGTYTVSVLGRARTGGFLGVGFSPTGAMEGSDAVVYGDYEATGVKVATYNLVDGGVNPDHSFLATQTSGKNAGGWTELRYTRQLGTGFVLLKKNAAVHLVWAYHSSMTIEHHDYDGSQLITLAEPATAAITPTLPKPPPTLKQSSPPPTVSPPMKVDPFTPPVTASAPKPAASSPMPPNVTPRPPPLKASSSPPDALGPPSPTPESSPPLKTPSPLLPGLSPRAPPASPKAPILPNVSEPTAAPAGSPPADGPGGADPVPAPAPGPAGGAPPPLRSGSCGESSLSGYACSQLVSSNEFGVHLAWNIDGNGDQISFAMTAPTTGWLALGWSQQGEMIGSDAVIAMDSPFRVSAYHMTDESKDKVIERPTLFSVTNSSVTSDGKTSTLRFQRVYGDGLVPMVKGAVSTMIWAYSPNNDPNFAYHSDRRGAFALSLDVNSNSSTLQSQVQPLAQSEPLSQLWFQLHGWLAFAAFGVLFPLGVFAARFGQAERFSPQWYHLHRGIVVAGLVVATISVAIAIKKFNDHLDNTHARLGLAVMLLVWVQPFIGVFRPTLGSPGRIQWYSMHWLVGTVTVILGAVNIYLGLDAYKEYATTKYYPGKKVRTTYSVYIAFFGFAYLLLSQLPYIKHQGQKPSFYQQGPMTSNKNNSAKRLIEDDTNV